MEWIPAGYLQFQNLAGFLLKYPKYNGYLRRNIEKLDLLSIEESLRVSLGPDLASGLIRAAGIDMDSKKLVWVPAEAWRHMEYIEGVQVTAFDFALSGFVTTIWHERLNFDSVRAIISQAEFCRWCSEEPVVGLVDPPLTPDGRNVTASTIPISGDARSTLWMRAYALGMNDAGSKPKRDPTLKLCQAEVAVSWRQAKTAWDTLPAEWKNPNRLPK